MTEFKTTPRAQRRLVSKAFFQQTWAFLKQNKDLVFLPILSFIALVILLAVTISGVIIDLADVNIPMWSGIVIALVGYAVMAFVVIFTQAWLVACVYERLHDRSCTLSQGFAMTIKRTPQLIGWALFSGTVGLIINMLENAHNIFADIIAAIIGLAWSLAIYFVIPVVVVTGAGPFSAFKQSSKVFGKSWYKVVRFYAYYAWIIFIAVIIAFFVAKFDPQWFAQNLQIWVPTVIVVLVAMSLFGRLFNAVVQSALYMYYMDKQVPSIFSEALLQQAFMQKNSGFSRRKE